MLQEYPSVSLPGLTPKQPAPPAHTAALPAALTAAVPEQ